LFDEPAIGALVYRRFVAAEEILFVCAFHQAQVF
jgi:hypothetical protein